MNTLEVIKKVMVNEFPKNVIDIDKNRIIMDLTKEDDLYTEFDFFEIVSDFTEQMGLMFNRKMEYEEGVCSLIAEIVGDVL